MAYRPRLANAVEAHLGYWIRLVSTHASLALSRVLEAKNVTMAEWLLLRQLYTSHPLAPSTIADTLGMTRGAVTRLADRLVEKAMVTRMEGTDDRRFKALTLTKLGWDLVPVLAKLADASDAKFFSDLSSGHRRVVRESMKMLVRKKEIREIPKHAEDDNR